MRKKRVDPFPYLLLLPAVLLMFAVNLTPIVQGFYMSLLKLNQFTLGQYLDAPFIGLENYRRVLFDADNLYFGVHCYDSVPDGIIVNDLRRDFNSYDSDAFGVALPSAGRQSDSLRGGAGSACRWLRTTVQPARSAGPSCTSRTTAAL